MASTLEVFNSARQYIQDGTIDFDANNIYLALVASTYTKDLTHSLWASISPYEAANGTGYTTGGVNLAGNDVTYSGAVATWDADNVAWVTLTKVFRFGVLYVNATVNSIVKPLIAITLFDDTGGGANISISGVDYSVIWNTSGILTLSGG